jgi:hypothetical protein
MYKSFYLCGPRLQINLIAGMGLNFLIEILVVCGLPPGDYNLNSGCHEDSKPANFSPPVCFPTGEAGKNADTGFMRCCLNFHYRKSWVENDKIYIYIVKANFSKLVGLKGTVRKF